MNKLLSVLNLIVVLAIIYWNYYTAAVGYNGNDIGELSRKYDNLFTPASYAFSIWGLIFLGLVGLTTYIVKKTFVDGDDQIVQTIGWSLLVANIFNGVWTYLWLLEKTGFSVWVMICILLSLLYCITKLEKSNIPEKGWNKWLVYVPVGIYTGWISVAIIANTAAHLNKSHWHPLVGEINWTLAMIVIASMINIYMIRRRHWFSYGCIGVWALIALSLRHWDLVPVLQWVSLLSALTLVMTMISAFISKTTKA